ncbi:MAG: DUF4835 family protein [Porphyromonas sp.]|nr:DUF4835 family protein [Porphyromonas sp.]
MYSSPIVRTTVKYFLLALGLLFAQQVSAQQLIFPEVQVTTLRVAETQIPQLTSLQEKLQQMLLGYRPNVEVNYSPIQPIRTVVQLRIRESIGSRYRGDLELVMLRPIYGEESESVVYLANESDIEFELDRSYTGVGIGNTLPEHPLFRRLFYHITMGSLYYYDSFASLGGTPFLTYLEEHRTRFEELYQNGAGSNLSLGGSYLAPQRHLSEIKGAWGTRFRELWYFYHREALDSDTPEEYGELLVMMLEGLEKIREENSSLTLIQYFSDTKSAEINERLSRISLSPSLQQSLTELLQRLMPGTKFEL